MPCSVPLTHFLVQLLRSLHSTSSKPRLHARHCQPNAKPDGEHYTLEDTYKHEFCKENESDLMDIYPTASPIPVIHTDIEDESDIDAEENKPCFELLTDSESSDDETYDA